MDLKPGFYRCDRWPHWFMVNVPRLDPVPCVWGFSIWKNVAGYRTLGVRLAEWLSRDEQKGIVIEPDHDRTADKAWLREYRAAAKAKKPPTAAAEIKTLRAENAALRERVAVLERVREAAIVADDFVWGTASDPYIDPKTTVPWVRQFHKVRDGLREALAAAKPAENGAWGA